MAVGCARITLVLYRKRTVTTKFTVKLELKEFTFDTPLEGSRSRVRRTRDAMGIQSIFA